VGKMKQVLVKTILSPHFSMGLGIVLVLCGILETTETFIEQFMVIDVKGHHGIIIFGLGQIMKSLVDILEGVEGLVVAKDAKTLEEEIKEFEKKDK
jgi:hypothetical protein